MIWVVTGHKQTRETLPQLIAGRGYAVADFDCGDAMSKRLRFQTPLVIIIDCALPDSFDLIAAIRSDPRARQTPVVMFSIDDQNLKEKALLKGADAFVGKGSLDWVELLEEIHRYAGPPQAPERPDDRQLSED